MSTETPRDLIAQADRYRRTADAADMAMVHIRLGARPRLLLGLIRIGRDRSERVFTADETSAIYEALAIVRDDHQHRAAECEARVTTTERTEP